MNTLSRVAADAGAALDGVTSAVPELIETTSNLRGAGAAGVLAIVVIAVVLIRRRIPKTKDTAAHEATKVAAIGALERISMAAIQALQDKRPGEEEDGDKK
jgi:hypothetical protein